ncbi:MAG: Asp23/Gls24 family envelope stress response protein [Deltaproteobacteria bacterium]|nr:MAG: Asp23/Gls24 family envelope stress response protein [Deltaproteobacteria bacterium]
MNAAGPSLTIESLPHTDAQVGGVTNISEAVVASLAERAARQAEWIHALGKPRFFGFDWRSAKRAIGAEVGQHEAAIDLEVVARYGCDIRTVVAELRDRIGREVDQMCGRRVVEVNVRVVGVHLAEESPEAPPSAPPRVR